MKLLFLLYDFYPNFGANSYIIYDLAKAFTENGHEVHVFPMTASSDSKEKELWEHIQIHRTIQSFDKKQVYKFLQEFHYFSAIKLVTAILKDLNNTKEYQKLSWSYYSYKCLRSIVKQDRIDIIINVCYPFEACLPVLKYLNHEKKSFRWIIYMLDPFATNFHYLKKYPREELLQFQSKVFEKADKIIVTAPIMKELKGGLDILELEKYQVLNFPKIKKPYIKPAVDDILFDRHYINCVFVGKFNRETRNPLSLFRLFEGLNHEKIILHIIGEERNMWKEFLSDTAGNILFYGIKSREASVNAQLRANILVNVGNDMNNQLPSKLLEYISMGKPIVNLYKRNDCPTLYYTAQYPLCINIHEDQSNYLKTLVMLRYFCLRYRRTNINYHYIKNKFYYCTLDYVISEFLNLFDELMEDIR